MLYDRMDKINVSIGSLWLTAVGRQVSNSRLNRQLSLVVVDFLVSRLIPRVSTEWILGRNS